MNKESLFQRLIPEQYRNLYAVAYSIISLLSILLSVPRIVREAGGRSAGIAAGIVWGLLLIGSVVFLMVRWSDIARYRRRLVQSSNVLLATGFVLASGWIVYTSGSPVRLLAWPAVILFFAMMFIGGSMLLLWLGQREERTLANTLKDSCALFQQTFLNGIAEAMNATKEMYGFERFHAALEKWHDLPATAIRDRLLADVKEFTGAAAQHDDMTVVVVRVL